MVMDLVKAQNDREYPNHSKLGFLSLPPELRVNIYRYSLIAKIQPIDLPEPAVKQRLRYTPPRPNDRIIENGQPKGSQLSVALLATCSTIHNEALPVLYSENTFAVHPIAKGGPLLYRNWILEAHLDPRCQPCPDCTKPCEVLCWLSEMTRNDVIRRKHFNPHRTLVRKIEVIMPAWLHCPVDAKQILLDTHGLDGIHQLTYVLGSVDELYPSFGVPMGKTSLGIARIGNTFPGLDLKARAVQWRYRSTPSPLPSFIAMCSTRFPALASTRWFWEEFPNGTRAGESEVPRHGHGMHPETVEAADSDLQLATLVRDRQRNRYLEDSLPIRHGWISLITPDPSLDHILDTSLAFREMMA